MKRKAYDLRYNLSEKGKARHHRYNHSGKGLERYRRSRDSDEYRERNAARMRMSRNPRTTFRSLLGI